MEKYFAGIDQYDDENNSEDRGNGCYFIILSPGKPYILDEVDDHYYGEEISSVTGIDFLGLARKYNGFEDSGDVFFPKREDARKCMKELLHIINH